MVKCSLKHANLNTKINVLFFVSRRSYNFYFDKQRSNLDILCGWLPKPFGENLKTFVNFFQGICILVWLWFFSFRKEYIIICCDNRRDAEIFRELYGIQEIIFVSDIVIKKSIIGKLNQQYKKDLTFLHTCVSGAELNTRSTKLFKVDVSENTNIFLTMGEYDSVTDFELALEAFYVLYTYKLKSSHLRRATYLVILGDEIDFKLSQENYFKKLEGFVYKHGLQSNVFFLRIFPYVSKTVIMKVSLGIIFTNTRGCYQTNLHEAIKSGKHIIAPKSQFYHRLFTKYGLKSQYSLFSPNPEDYAAQMYKHIRNKILFRFLAKGIALNIKN